MGDSFSIDTVENLYTEIMDTEISDISKIIKAMIDIKNGKANKAIKKSKIYDIDDKLRINKISNTISAKIRKYHIDSYDIIDNAICCIEEYEPVIRSDLYDLYYDEYIDILIEMDIDITNEEIIKENADRIYLAINKKIKDDLYFGKKTDIQQNKIITYISAISAYVFYNCKFLIPIENVEII